MSKKSKKKLGHGDVTRGSITLPGWVVGNTDEEAARPKTAGQCASKIRALKTRIIMDKNMDDPIRKALMAALARAVCREHLAGTFTSGMFCKLRQEITTSASVWQLDVPFPTSAQLDKERV